MAPSTFTAGGSHTIALLLDTSGTVREIIKLLKNNEAKKELKHFYIRFIAHCVIVTDQANRIKAALRPDNELIVRILVQFESIVTKHVLKESSISPVLPYPRLWALNQHWNRLRNCDNSAKLGFIRHCLNFGQFSEQHNEFFESLDKWEDDLTAQYPEDPSQWSKDDFTPEKMRGSEPSYAVWNAAQSLFKALIASKNCTCEPTHEFGARLCLGTYRKPGDDTDVDNFCDFDMFLSMKQDWHEVHVHTVNERIVRFALNNEQQHSRGKNHGSPAKRVRKLCEPIKKKRKFPYRLDFKVEDGSLWKLRSERSSFPVDMTKTPVSLDQLIKEGPRSLTEKTKRILAVLLGYAVLHLHGTPWLQPTWNSSSIIFFHTASSAIPLRPFIQTELVQGSTGNTTPNLDDDGEQERGMPAPDNFDPDEMDVDPDDLVLHQCPSLVTLAVMLMELYLATPFKTLAKKYGIDLPEGIENCTISIDADLVFRECKSEIPENCQFRYAVENCLDPKIWEDDNGKKLDNQMLRTMIYQEVVRPLEDELSQAFSYISIDTLDKIAETLDFGSWGQTIQNRQVEGHSSWARSGEAYIPPDIFVSPHVPQSLMGLEQHFQQPDAYARGHTPAGVPLDAQRLEQKMARESNYKASRFFDDETLSDDCFLKARVNYSNPKDKFQAVYRKFIQVDLQQPPQCPVKIAVLDTGIDLTHPDVDARIEQIKDMSNWINKKFKNMTVDHDGHGTFTAGLLLDYAPDAEIYIAKIAENRPSNPRVIAEAINFAVNKWEVDIISMSFGFPTCDIDGYRELESAIVHAYSKHVLMFAAASNSGANLGIAYPARHQNVICINSTDAHGNRSRFSPNATSIGSSLATIGEAVESAWPIHLCDDIVNPTYVEYKSGTSYATPIAAGIAAFLLQYARLYLTDKADMLKRQSKMEAVFRKIAQSQETKIRDDYHYVALSLYCDNLFGKDKEFINGTINDLLQN